MQGISVRRVLGELGAACLVRNLPLTCTERMGFDVGIRRERVEAVADLDELLRAGLVDRIRLDRYLAASHERCVRWARAALALADGRAESRQETRLRLLLLKARLDPVPQYEIWDEHGFVARLDLAFPECKVAVEYDGVWHADARQLAKDRKRLNRLQAAGWHVVFVTASQLHSTPALIITEIRQAMKSRHSRA